VQDRKKGTLLCPDTILTPRHKEHSSRRVSRTSPYTATHPERPRPLPTRRTLLNIASSRLVAVAGHDTIPPLALEFLRELSGPFHLTRYCSSPRILLLSRISSISYSASPSTMTGWGSGMICPRSGLSATGRDGLFAAAVVHNCNGYDGVAPGSKPRKRMRTSGMGAAGKRAARMRTGDVDVNARVDSCSDRRAAMDGGGSDRRASGRVGEVGVRVSDRTTRKGQTLSNFNIEP
jgi:hypothetical protein